MTDGTISTGGKAQLFRSVFEQNVIGIVLVELDGKVIECNAAFRDMLGYTERELQGLSILNLTHPDDLPASAAFFHGAARRQAAGPGWVTEKRYLRKDGTIAWGRINATVIRDTQGEPVFAFAAVEDITKRKEAENRLAAEKERLAITLHCIGDAVIAIDGGGRITLFNEIASLFTGWTEPEARGRLLSEVLNAVDGKTRQSLAPLIEDAIRSRNRLATRDPWLLVSRNGIERWVSGSGNPIAPPSTQAEGMVFVFRDVTDKVRAEEERARTEKLESLGYLAGGIAHDFNNLLTVILGNISLSRREVPPGGESAVLLQQAEQAALDARNLTQQLLTFAKGGLPVKQVVSLAHLIREATASVLGESPCRPELLLPEDLWPIEADPDLVGQVIRHLVVNACQAMPGGGSLLVSATNVTVEADPSGTLIPGRYVKTLVRDSGVGIPEHHLDKVFDPYFTTKQTGSGLGLAASLSVVRNHGGHIAVESRVGVGTSFHVYLPAARTGTAPLRPAPVPRMPARTPRVLVMDDEAAIRQLASRILSRSAFEVHTAADGEEMLKLFAAARSGGVPFDVVVLDLTVREGMGGKDAVKRLLGIDPNARVIVSSGYSNDPIMSRYREFGFRAIVAKPYQPEALLNAVRDVMAEGTQR